MKRTLRILSVALVFAVILIASVFSASAAADYTITDAANAEAVIAQALEAAKTADVTVELNTAWTLSGDVTIGSADEIPANTLTITTSASGSINVNGNLLSIYGNVVYDGLQLSGNDATKEKNAFFSPNGTSITIKNATVGAKKANVIGANLTVTSGTFEIVAANIGGTNYTVNGANITVTGGTISKVLGGSYQLNKFNDNKDYALAIDVPSTVVIGTQGSANGPTITDLVGGSWYAASQYMGATVTIYSGSIKDLVVCGLGYMTAEAAERNALYTVNFNGGSITGRYSIGSATDQDIPSDKMMHYNAVLNINSSVGVTGFAGAAMRTSDGSTKLVFHAQGNVVVNVSSTGSLKNFYAGSYIQKTGSTSDIDVTLNVAPGAALNGTIYGGSNISAANCSETGDCTIKIGEKNKTSVVKLNGELYVGAYLSTASAGSTVKGTSTLNANYLDLNSYKKNFYAGSYVAGKNVNDEREISITVTNSALYYAYLGSRLSGAGAKSSAQFTANISDTTLGQKLVGGCHFNGASVEQSGDRTINLTRVDVTGEFYGAGIFMDAAATSEAPSKRTGTTTLNIKDCTTRNAVTLFGSKVDKLASDSTKYANYFIDEGTINVVVDGFNTVTASNVYTMGYNGNNASDAANKFYLDMNLELKKVNSNDTFFMGIGGYKKGTTTVGTSADPVNIKCTVDTATVTATMANIKVACGNSIPIYANQEYVIKENGIGVAKTKNNHNNVGAAITAINNNNPTVDSSDYSIVGSSIRLGNLAMRCRAQLDKTYFETNTAADATTKIVRTGILASKNSDLLKFDLVAANGVNGAFDACAYDGDVNVDEWAADEENYPNSYLFAVAITGYENAGVLDVARANTAIYFRGYIVLEQNNIQEIVYLDSPVTGAGQVNYSKTLCEAAVDAAATSWYADLTPAQKSKVDEIAAKKA